MKIDDDVTVEMGGRFDKQNLIDENSFVDETGSKCLQLTREQYMLLKEDELLDGTRRLTDEQAAAVCKRYEGKCLSFGSYEYDGEMDGVEVVDVKRVELDRETATFKLYGRTKIWLTTDEEAILDSFDRRDDGLVETDLPATYNDSFIAGADDFVVPDEEMYRLLGLVYNEYAAELGNVGAVIDKLEGRMIKSFAKRNGIRKKKPRRKRAAGDGGEKK